MRQFKWMALLIVILAFDAKAQVSQSNSLQGIYLPQIALTPQKLKDQLSEAQKASSQSRLPRSGSFRDRHLGGFDLNAKLGKSEGSPNQSSCGSCTPDLLQTLADAARQNSGAAPDGAGHVDFDKRPYDILRYNCHSAANASVRQNPDRTGIITCGGAPQDGSPAHHTFNYIVTDSKTIFYNWGETCESSNSAVPPDPGDDENMSCIAKFCGKQFTGHTQQALEPGRQVEEPGPLYCSENTSTLKVCNSCCQYRGKYWDLATDDLRPPDKSFIEFMGACYGSCNKAFPPIPFKVKKP